MSKNTKIFISIVSIIIFLSAGLIYLASRENKKTASNTGEDNGVVAGASTIQKENYSADYIEKLAKFLTAKGAVMYGAYWCSHCKDQKEEFGDAFQYIDYVECDAKGPNANPQECQAKGIEGYPTWIYQGQKISGQKSLSDLAEIVGFSDTASNVSQ